MKTQIQSIKDHWFKFWGSFSGNEMCKNCENPSPSLLWNFRIFFLNFHEFLEIYYMQYNMLNYGWRANNDWSFPWSVVINSTLIFTYAAKRMYRYCYVFYNIFAILLRILGNALKKTSQTKILSVTSSVNHCLITNALDKRQWNVPIPNRT